MQRRFSALLHRELRDELHAVTGHQLSVLAYLRGQSVTMRELARELDVGESAATAVVAYAKGSSLAATTPRTAVSYAWP